MESNLVLKTSDLPSVSEMTNESLLRSLLDVDSMNACKTPKDAMQLATQGKSAGLAFYKKRLGEKPTKIFVKSIVARVCSFLNLNQNMSEDQIDMTAELIIEEFYAITPNDLWIWHKDFISGKSIQLFGRLDGQIILDSIRLYWSKRLDLAESISIENHQRIKSEDSNIKQLPDLEALKSFYLNQNNRKSETLSINVHRSTRGESLREKFGLEGQER